MKKIKNWVLLITIKEGKLKVLRRKIKLVKITRIEYKKINEGFKKIYSGALNENWGYFGKYYNRWYLLSAPIREFNYSNYIPINSKLGLTVFLTGRLGGVSKARSYTLSVGRVRTQTFNIPIDYCANPILTKWGYYGQKVYISCT